MSEQRGDLVDAAGEEVALLTLGLGALGGGLGDLAIRGGALELVAGLPGRPWREEKRLQDLRMGTVGCSASGTTALVRASGANSDMKGATV